MNTTTGIYIQVHVCAKSGMATTIMITVDICKWRETKYCKVVELLMGEFHYVTY